MCMVLDCRAGAWGMLVMVTTRLMINLKFMNRTRNGARLLSCIIARLCCLRKLLIRLITMVNIEVILNMCPMVLLRRLMTRDRSAFPVLYCGCCVGLLFINTYWKKLTLSRPILSRRRGVLDARSWRWRRNLRMRLAL